MTDAEIKKLCQDYGFDNRNIFHLAKEIERRTRHECFRLIQHANNALSARTLSPKQLEKLIWDFEHRERS